MKIFHSLSDLPQVFKNIRVKEKRPNENNKKCRICNSAMENISNTNIFVCKNCGNFAIKRK